MKGPFKTYFALNTNCVLLADTIVGQAGIDLVKNPRIDFTQELILSILIGSFQEKTAL